MYRHTLCHRTLLYRALQILHSLQIEGNTQNISEVCLSQSAGAVRIKPTTLGGFNNRNLFSHSPEAGS